MTDGAQELDEMLSKSKQIVATNYAEISKWSAIAHLELTEEVKQQIIDWHNKQIEELLDRLWQHSEVMNSDVVPAYGVPLSAIEGERNKLKEVK